MKYTIALLLCCGVGTLMAQPAMDIWLLEVDDSLGGFSLRNPINISHNTGYDNQPGFLPMGDGVIYTSEQADGQTDVVVYDIATRETERLTFSPGSEYSPTVTPDGQYFSTIVLEQDGTQLLHRYPLTVGGEPEVLIPEVVIGYHCWANDTLLLTFVLGDTMTLQRCVTTTGVCTVADAQIGRSLKISPLNGALTYISKRDSVWTVNMMNPLEGEGRSIGLEMMGNEDITWRGNGSLFTTKGTEIYRWRPGADPTWTVVADLSTLGIAGDLTRLEFSPDGKYLAVVANEE